MISAKLSDIKTVLFEILIFATLKSNQKLWNSLPQRVLSRRKTLKKQGLRHCTRIATIDSANPLDSGRSPDNTIDIEVKEFSCQRCLNGYASSPLCSAVYY